MWNVQFSFHCVSLGHVPPLIAPLSLLVMALKSCRVKKGRHMWFASIGCNWIVRGWLIASRYSRTPFSSSEWEGCPGKISYQSPQKWTLLDSGGSFLLESREGRPFVFQLGSLLGWRIENVGEGRVPCESQGQESQYSICSKKKKYKSSLLICGFRTHSFD